MDGGPEQNHNQQETTEEVSHNEKKDPETVEDMDASTTNGENNNISSKIQSAQQQQHKDNISEDLEKEDTAKIENLDEEIQKDEDNARNENPDEQIQKDSDDKPEEENLLQEQDEPKRHVQIQITNSDRSEEKPEDIEIPETCQHQDDMTTEEDPNELDVLIKPQKKKLSEDSGVDIDGYPTRKWSPRKDAFFFSRYISFFWMTNLLVKGSKKVLDKEDLEGILPGECTHPLTERLERNWQKVAYNNDGTLRKEASLFKALFKTFGWRFLALGLLPFLSEILKLVQPVLIGLLIQYFLEGSTMTRDRAYLYAFLIVFFFFVISWCEVSSAYGKNLFGAKARIAITGLIYKKILRSSPQQLSNFTTGHIVNLVSADTPRFEIAPRFLHHIFICPIVFIILCALLYRELEACGFVAIGFLLLLSPSQMIIGKFVMIFRRKGLKITDERVKYMNEIISGMKIIKLYTWEEPFTKIIERLRRVEIQAVKRVNFLRGSLLSFFLSSGSLISFFTFMIYVLAGNELTSKKVFTTLGLLNSARAMFTLMLPIALAFLFELHVCLGRIHKFLVSEEPLLDSKLLRPKLKDCGVSGKNITASWNEETPTLKGISFNVKAGELLAVIGSVGSGKSSLLMAILKELELSEGEVDVKGKVAYSSQEPWIFNGTVRYNITFNHEFDERRYNDVIKACALEKDLKLFANGDKTLVGERGVSLSGGQKARISLARAVYSDADIYLLDDPLSAVDAQVARHLYDNCINGYLADKVKILVTHQQQFLTNATVIMALKDGHCVCQGSIDEINCLSVDIRSSLLFDESEDTGFESCSPDPCPEPACPKYLRSMSTINTPFNDVSSSLSIGKDVEEDMVEEENNVLIPKEEKQDGSISFSVYLRFFRSGSGIGTWLMMVLLFAVGQAFQVVGDWWLAFWSTQEERHPGNTYDKRERDLAIYAVLTFLLFAFGMARGFAFFNVFLKSAEKIHLQMFYGIMRAPMYFFDTNSMGRILNRFSKDSNLVDDILGFSAHEVLTTVIALLGVFALVAVNMPIVLALLIPIVIIGVMTRTYYIKTARELRRLESVGRSPVYNHLSTTILGLSTIRSHGAENRFFDMLADLQDEHSEPFIAYLSSYAWLHFTLELLCAFFVTFCAFIPLLFAENFTGGTVGLLLVYALSIPPFLQRLVMWTTELESNFTSVERIQEYADIEPEAALVTDVKPNDEWPDRGSIMFENVQFRYHDSLPEILHGVNAHIKPQEKIGVCGRTGAGKSSLLSALFRTAELTGGHLVIDGMDIQTLGLKDLRKKLSIIPQEPVLFSGTMRRNLDPFSLYTDKQLWEALEEVRLKDTVAELPGKLESEITESGSNLSVGQKQLVCLARAILENNRILVIDEATANVDVNTDTLIQETIRTKFKNCTVLTIAHRLNTIMDSSRIMVLDAGNLKEFDRPYKLLRCKKSILYSLVMQTGKEDARALFHQAYKSYVEVMGEQEGEFQPETMADCNFKCSCKRKSRSGSKTERARSNSSGKTKRDSKRRHSSKCESPTKEEKEGRNRTRSKNKDEIGEKRKSSKEEKRTESATKESTTKLEETAKVEGTWVETKTEVNKAEVEENNEAIVVNIEKTETDI